MSSFILIGLAFTLVALGGRAGARATGRTDRRFGGLAGGGRVRELGSMASAACGNLIRDAPQPIANSSVDRDWLDKQMVKAGDKMCKQSGTRCATDFQRFANVCRMSFQFPRLRTSSRKEFAQLWFLSQPSVCHLTCNLLLDIPTLQFLNQSLLSFPSLRLLWAFLLARALGKRPTTLPA